MLKNKTILEHKCGDRLYELQCDPASPLGELYDALSIMKAFVYERIVEAQNAEKQSQESKE